MLKYVFTKIGDVYSGWDFSDHFKYPKHTIIIQGTKKREYRELSNEQKTIGKIKEYGWIIRDEMIVGEISDEQFQPPRTNPIQGDSWHNGFDRSTMFIFGAGASAHCVYDKDSPFYKDSLRPPLAPGLFDERFQNIYKKYRGVKQSLHFLQESDSPDVEQLFEQEWKNIITDSNEEVLSRHINIQYYLQELLKEVSNRVIDEYYSKNLYARMSDKIQKKYAKSVRIEYGQKRAKNFAFVSFNQDNLLEHFLAEYFGTPLNSIDDYVNIESPFCVFKPHGSYDWGWEFPDTSQFNGDTPSWLFDNNKNFHQVYYELLGSHLDMIDWTHTFGTESSINKHRIGKYTIDKSKVNIIDTNKLGDYFPALILPYRDKDEFTMPLRHFQNMQFYFQYIETLIIIGWKGNEEAFNRQLLQHARMIKKVVIADPDSATVIKNLEPILSKFNIEPVIYDNFEHFVNEGIDEELS